MDEARVGQKGRLCHRWWLRGRRPPGRCDRRFEWAYVFAAVEPATGADVALVLPEATTATMGLFLAEFAARLPEGVHAALVLDRAGWHVSRQLAVPANVTLVPLPAYSPELVWGFACQALTIAASPSRLLSGVQPAGDRSRRSEGSPL
jgi:hypothetical protein